MNDEVSDLKPSNSISRDGNRLMINKRSVSHLFQPLQRRSVPKVSDLTSCLRARTFNRPLQCMNVNSTHPWTPRMPHLPTRRFGSRAVCIYIQRIFCVCRFVSLVKIPERSDPGIFILFRFKLRTNCAENIEMLLNAFENECLAKRSTTKWYKPSKNWLISVDSNPDSGRLSTTTTSYNIQCVQLAVQAAPRLTVREVENGSLRTTVWKF